MRGNQGIADLKTDLNDVTDLESSLAQQITETAAINQLHRDEA